MANPTKTNKVAVTLNAYNGKVITVKVIIPTSNEPTIREALEEVLKAVGAYKVSEINTIELELDADRI